MTAEKLTVIISFLYEGQEVENSVKSVIEHPNREVIHDTKNNTSNLV